VKGRILASVSTVSLKCDRNDTIREGRSTGTSGSAPLMGGMAELFYMRLEEFRMTNLRSANFPIRISEFTD